MKTGGAHDVRPLYSRRLSAIAALVPMGSGVVADVGADHGALSALLLKKGRCRRVILSDISAASLEKARRLFGDAGRACAFAVSDGLSHLTPGEADVIVIAGMGSERIAGILAAGMPAARQARLVLQPNVDAEPLRRFLAENGFRIVDEDLVFENRRFYAILAAEAGTEGPHAPLEWSVGWIPLRAKKPELLELLRHRERVWEKALRAAGKAGETGETVDTGTAPARSLVPDLETGDMGTAPARSSTPPSAPWNAAHATASTPRAQALQTELDRIREAIASWTP